MPHRFRARAVGLADLIGINRSFIFLKLRALLNRVSSKLIAGPMNFAQLHERVRIEMLRRIENGSLSVTLLAHQIGVSSAHVSNFLNARRNLSLDKLDRILRAHFLTVDDIYPERRYSSSGIGFFAPQTFDAVPLVEPATAFEQAHIRSESILEIVKVRNIVLGSIRDKCSVERRREWDRFVAVKVSEEESATMKPLLRANAVVLIDRHYNSTMAYTRLAPTVYAVRFGNRLHFRYITLLERHLLLRAHDPAHQPELLPFSHGKSAADYLVGRVFMNIAEL
jgi:transcriptional regulator with XRE-family HTH domain